MVRNEPLELKKGYYYMSSYHEIVQLVDWNILGVDYKVIYTPWKKFEGQLQTMKHAEFIEKAVIMSKELTTLEILYGQKT